jgi:hypothetical protein
VEIWRTQNIYWNAVGEIYPDVWRKAEAGDAAARTWVDVFTSVGDKLAVQLNGRAATE